MSRDVREEGSLLRFWWHVFRLLAAGKIRNHHRKSDRLALNMKEVREAFAASGLQIPIDRGLYATLRAATYPKLEKEGAVNAGKGTPGRTVHCWVFSIEE